MIGRFYVDHNLKHDLAKDSPASDLVGLFPVCDGDSFMGMVVANFHRQDDAYAYCEWRNSLSGT